MPRVRRREGRDASREPGVPRAGFFDQARGKIDEVGLVAKVREERRIGARRAADIDDAGRRRRENAAQDFLRAFELELKGSALEARFLGVASVVLDDLARRWV